MKAGRFCRGIVILLSAGNFEVVLPAIEPTPLTLSANGAQIQLSWPSAIVTTNQTLVFPEYEIQSSGNLSSWTPLPGKMCGLDGRGGAYLNRSLDRLPGAIFYRVRANLDPHAPGPTADGGDAVFGFNDVFAKELQVLSQLSLEDFATNGSNIPYLSGINWDPTTAQFWPSFAPTNQAGWPHLSTNEATVVMTNGFVVSQRLGNTTFGASYYNIFQQDLPVFITSDSVLHAWHRSYQSMLEELEEIQLSTLLAGIISNMSAQLPATWQQYGDGPLTQSILDADLFLTVARSLWAGQQMPSALGDGGTDQQVSVFLNAVQAQTLQDMWLFGSPRVIDFSQFKVRGHYDASERLRRYFQTTMWCSRIDFRLVTFEPNKEDDLRQLGGALVLQHLLVQSGEYTNWSSLEQITRTFVGVTDSMTSSQLGDLVAVAGIHPPANVPDLITLSNLQTRILTGELGVQSIHSDFFFSPLGSEQLRLPRSFTLCGQKFVSDSWAMSQVVFDRIHAQTGDAGGVFGDKVIRRKPSCLDVAYSTLANDQIVPELVSRIRNTNGVRFRDGLPYQHNLLAVRKVIDAQSEASWEDNIYTAWLAALRSLSAPTTDSKYPQAMRTRAWAMKTINTQLASWTELRHDTILYAKQSYTEPGTCSYPYGFVEPRPEFWQRMKQLADVTAAAISKLPLSGSVLMPSRDPGQPGPEYFNFEVIKWREVAFSQGFSARMAQLQVMAQKELDQQPFSPDEIEMLKNTIEQPKYYTGVPDYNGWYPELFYTNALGGQIAVPFPGCSVWDALAVDVHTDLPDPIVNDPGAVIHEAVGNVHLLVIAIDNGPDRMVYAGPVLSHYEFEEPGVTRLSDPDWQSRLSSAQKPSSPEWTQSYLIP